MNSFDYSRPKAYVRQNGSKKKTVAGVTYSDVLCHGEGWSVRGIGECRQDELMHWGIKGQKWGIRRFQNEDGSLTEEGKKRYNAGYSYGQKIFESDQLKGKALIGLGPKGVYKYGKYVRKKEKEEFEKRYGKTKEEQKKNIDKEWEELTRKENAERDLGQKMNKFDKASPEEQNKALKDVKKEMDKLEAKHKKDGGLTNEDNKKLDGLLDWYLQKAYIKNKKLIEDWHAERFSYGADFAASSKAQREYCQKLAKALDLPQDLKTYSFLENWFITFDD